ncbi:hypothetical protein [Parasitella parasitica]|uniref:F-box domain-containing protein n=1 Tax=Parasitella parasitica TaxID=35722 RepID=A0A0B7NGK5_9FUNG|nr:hypothetical protein [Parasitella parasitica]
MANWTQLPYELLQEIFAYVPSSRFVYECLFVCKSWYRPARYGLFKHLYFANEEQLNKYLAALKKAENCNYELMAESIDIRGVYDRPIHSPVVHLLDKCTNLKSIIDNGESSRYQLIKSAHSRHKLSKVELLAPPMRYSAMKIYIECAVEFREQLKRLDVIEASNWSLSSTIFATLYSILDQFVKLQELYLEKAADLDTLDFIFDSCKALQSLEVKLSNPISMRFFGFESLDLQEDDNVIDYTKITPQPLIHTAKFQLHSISAKSMEYIQHKFPRLQSLNLTSYTSSPEPVTVSNTVLLDFILSLRKIPHVDIPIAFEASDALDVVAKFLVVTNFEGVVDISNKLVSHTSHFLDNPLISYSSKSTKKQLQLKYVKGTFQQHPPLRGPTVMPHLTLLEVVGSYIKQLVINRLNNKFVGGTVNAYFMIDHTLNCCPFLRNLGFVGCYLVYLPILILPTPHLFMESLRFEECQLNCQTFIKLSLIMPKLKTIVMKNCSFTSYSAKRQANSSTRRSISLHFPFTSFDSFRFQNIQNYRPLSRIYLKLIIGKKVTYTAYSRDKKRCNVISQAAFDAPKVESDSLHIDLLCKCLKEFIMN